MGGVAKVTGKPGVKSFLGVVPSAFGFLLTGCHVSLHSLRFRRPGAFSGPFVPLGLGPTDPRCSVFPGSALADPPPVALMRLMVRIFTQGNPLVKTFFCVKHFFLVTPENS